jgi:hypothetical protein
VRFIKEPSLSDSELVSDMTSESVRRVGECTGTSDCWVVSSCIWVLLKNAAMSGGRRSNNGVGEQPLDTSVRGGVR